MRQKKWPPLIMLIILAFSAINSSELFLSWLNSPIEKFSWLVFLIWLIPLAIYWFENTQNLPAMKSNNTLLAVLAMLIGLFSVMTSLNALAYVGLALAIAACLPWIRENIIWLVSSVSWMPGLGWYLTHLFPSSNLFVLQILRLCIVVIGIFLWVFLKNKHEKVNG